MRFNFTIKLQALIFIATLLVLLFTTELGFLDNFRISLESLFSGLLALTGFIFTARTFVTFKLNEVVYGNPTYQKYIENLKKDGAYQKALYDPLRNMDSNLGRTTFMCLVSIVFIVLLGFFDKFSTITFSKWFHPKYLSDFAFSKAGWICIWQNHLLVSVVIYKLYAAMAFSFLLITLIKLFECVISMNRNISSIIDHWEKTYKEQQKDESKS
jgi:hypothetical protein